MLSTCGFAVIVYHDLSASTRDFAKMWDRKKKRQDCSTCISSYSMGLSQLIAASRRME